MVQILFYGTFLVSNRNFITINLKIKHSRFLNDYCSKFLFIYFSKSSFFSNPVLLLYCLNSDVRLRHQNLSHLNKTLKKKLKNPMFKNKNKNLNKSLTKLNL